MRDKKEKRRRGNKRKGERKSDRERQIEVPHGVRQNEPAQIWRD